MIKRFISKQRFNVVFDMIKIDIQIISSFYACVDVFLKDQLFALFFACANNSVIIESNCLLIQLHGYKATMIPCDCHSLTITSS